MYDAKAVQISQTVCHVSQNHCRQRFAKRFVDRLSRKQVRKARENETKYRLQFYLHYITQRAKCAKHRHNPQRIWRWLNLHNIELVFFSLVVNKIIYDYHAKVRYDAAMSTRFQHADFRRQRLKQ